MDKKQEVESLISAIRQEILNGAERKMQAVKKLRQDIEPIMSGWYQKYPKQDD